MTDKQLTFIVSGGRTGTQFFGDLLGDVISDCHSEHEPDMVAGLTRLTWERIRRFGLWHMIVGRILGQTGVRVIGQRYLEGSISIEQARNLLRATREGYHRGIDQSLVVESYYAWWMVSKKMQHIWPGAKVVGILRDPRDWIASWLRRAGGRRNGALTERLPPGPLEPARIGDHKAARIWPELDQVGRLAWEWGVIAETLSQASETSGTVKVFRFEDLFGGDTKALDVLVAFVAQHAEGPAHDVGDLSSLRRDVRNASTGTKPRWSDWTDAQIAAIDHFCGPRMETYGYGTEDAWRARVASVAPLGTSER